MWRAAAQEKGIPQGVIEFVTEIVNEILIECFIIKKRASMPSPVVFVGGGTVVIVRSAISGPTDRIPIPAAFLSVDIFTTIRLRACGIEAWIGE